MPCYEFECPKCKRIAEIWATPNELKAGIWDSMICKKCNVALQRKYRSFSIGKSRPEKFFQPSPNARDSVKERHRKEVIAMNKDSEKQYQRMKKQQGM